MNDFNTEKQLYEDVYSKTYDIHALQKNIKRLRQIYGLSHNDLGYMNLLIKRSTISSWETGARIPTADNLLLYPIIFGTSLDWLFGITEVPYIQSSIEFAERKCYQGIAHVWQDDKINEDTFLSLESSTEKKFFRDALKNYCNHTVRKNDYSLEARANILVLYRLESSILMFDSYEIAKMAGKLFVQGKIDESEIVMKDPNKPSTRSINRRKKVIDNIIKIVNLGNPVFTISGN